MFLEMLIRGNGELCGLGKSPQIDRQLMKLRKCANNCYQCLLFLTPGFEIFPPCMGLIIGVGIHTNWGNPKGKLMMSTSPGFVLHSVLLFPQIQNLISAPREALNGFHAV